MEYILNKWAEVPRFDKSDQDLGLMLATLPQPDTKDTGYHSDPGEQYHDPYLFNEMEQAVQVIGKVIANHGRIMIHGDYDVDGLTATAILAGFFNEFGIKAHCYIPDRLEEGYGLAQAGVDYAIANKVDLVITVDCGITSHTQVELLKAAKIKVVVTDHHQCLATLPLADACINPQWPGEAYPFKYLCGAGVALKLVQALCIFFKMDDEFRKYIDLACLGTIADMMQLEGENRHLVLEGLELFNHNSCPGINALLAQIGQTPNPITAQTLSFLIAPRLNAAGRMGKVKPALDILLHEDKMVLSHLAAELDQLNRQRKQIEQEVVTKAWSSLLANPSLAKSPLLILAGDDWHFGVLGIIAAQIARRLHRSTAILTSKTKADVWTAEDRYVALNGAEPTSTATAMEPNTAATTATAIEPNTAATNTDAMKATSSLDNLRDPAMTLTASASTISLHGSARAYGRIDLISIFKLVEPLLERFGGHKAAAGLEIKASELELVLAALSQMAELDPAFWQNQSETLNAAAELAPELLTIANIQSLKALEPFGQGNEIPKFILRNCAIVRITKIGKEKNHLQIIVQLTNGSRLKTVFFGAGIYADLLAEGQKIELLGSINLNEWLGRQEIQMQIEDLKIQNDAKVMIDRRNFARQFKNNAAAQRDLFGRAYKFLATALPTGRLIDPEWLSMISPSGFGYYLNPEICDLILKMFAESAILKLIPWQLAEKQVYLAQNQTIHTRFKLSLTQSYQMLMEE